MDAEQQTDMQRRCFNQEEYERLLSDLMNRINVASEEVRLSQIDKLTISYGLRFLRLELIKEAGSMPE
jgi:hypothetical protein